MGVMIHLHCFEYGRGKQDALLEYCETVHYYKRSPGYLYFLKGIPYIVGSRVNRQLSHNLSQDDYPILLEGIHCTYLLYKNIFPGRKVILRLHNIESDYYRQLAGHAYALFRKVYYLTESIWLKRYEKRIVTKADIVFTVTDRDAKRCMTAFEAKNVFHLPVFTAWNEVKCREGTGTYCLYQANLSVSENERVAIWITEEIFSTLNIPLVIAGKNPSSRLKQQVAKYAHISLIENPTQEQMQDIIENAQINLLPSFSDTGIKLKLLHALFCGRHCFVNDEMIRGTGLDAVCRIMNDAEEIKADIQHFFEQPFTESDIVSRREVLQLYFNNHKNISILINHIWDSNT